MELILSLFMRDVSPEDIGVVVPYRAQSRLIRSLIRRNLLDSELPVVWWWYGGTDARPGTRSHHVSLPPLPGSPRKWRPCFNLSA
jgi:hypothetical protein